jgi:hypothetical protein
MNPASQYIAGSEVLIKEIQKQPAYTTLLYGNSAVFHAGLMLCALLDKPVAVIDGAMRFNSYTLSTMAKLLHIPAKKLLQKTSVTRSFTAFQTEAAVTEKLPRFLKETHCPLVVILGLLDTYYDEQVKPNECKQSLMRIFDTFQTITKNNTHILIADVQVEHPPAGKEKLFSYTYNSCDNILSLQQASSGFQINEDRKVRSWDAITKPSRSLLNATERHGVNSAER